MEGLFGIFFFLSLRCLGFFMFENGLFLRVECSGLTSFEACLYSPFLFP